MFVVKIIELLMFHSDLEGFLCQNTIFFNILALFSALRNVSPNLTSDASRPIVHLLKEAGANLGS